MVIFIYPHTHTHTHHTHTETEGMGGVKGYMGAVVGEGWVEVMLMPYLYIKFSKTVNKKLHFLVTVCNCVVCTSVHLPMIV